eukprot:4093633-Amphidinium_carterae.4
MSPILLLSVERGPESESSSVIMAKSWKTWHATAHQSTTLEWKRQSTCHEAIVPALQTILTTRALFQVSRVP